MLVLDEVSLDRRLRHISAKVDKGQAVHVLGANGAGKSSLLSAIAGLLAIDSGSIRINNRSLSDYLPAELALIRGFQEQQQASVFAITVQESLQFFARRLTLPPLIEAAMDIAELMQRPIPTLSGGEARRVQITRVLMQIWPAIEVGNALILLDEPLQGLDVKHHHLLFELLGSLAQRGNTLLISHHDLNLCQQYAQHVWLMKDGSLVQSGAAEQVLSENRVKQVFDCKLRVLTDMAGNKALQTYL